MDSSPLRPRRSSFGPRALLGLIVVGAIAVVVYAAFLRTPSKTPATPLRLPGLHQLSHLNPLSARPEPCSPRTYPAGAQFTFEMCTSSIDPVAWARCSRLTYSVDAAHAPSGYTADLTRAIDDLAAATGLRFTLVSGTADIRISWDPSLYDPQPGSSGEAGSTDFRTTTSLTGTHVASAAIRLSSHLASGQANGIGELPVLLHELGHAVGLGHYTGAVAMNPVDRGFTDYQPGDLAGLAALYHPASCT